MNKILTASVLVALFTLATPSMAQDTSPSDPAPSAVITSININTANADQLAMLSGIGAAKASAIIAYREEHGPFNGVDDLTNVSGIGPSTVEKNRHLLTHK